MFSNHKELGISFRMESHHSRVKPWLYLRTAFGYTLEYREGSANGYDDSISRLPELATQQDLSGSISIAPAGDGGMLASFGRADIPMPPYRSPLSAWVGLFRYCFGWAALHICRVLLVSLAWVLCQD